MTAENKIIAFLSYLFLLPGSLIVLIFRRKFPSELWHARQSLLINLGAVLLFLIWFLLTWLILAIPIIGPLTAWFAFTMVIIAWIFFIFLWITGMIRALRGSEVPLAIVGGWAAKLPF